MGNYVNTRRRKAGRDEGMKEGRKKPKYTGTEDRRVQKKEKN